MSDNYICYYYYYYHQLASVNVFKHYRCLFIAFHQKVHTVFFRF